MIFESPTYAATLIGQQQQQEFYLKINNTFYKRHCFCAIDYFGGKQLNECVCVCFCLSVFFFVCEIVCLYVCVLVMDVKQQIKT